MSSIAKDSIARDFGATRVEVNAPKYWVFDKIEGISSNQSNSQVTIQGINLNKLNSIDAGSFGSNFSNSPYSANKIPTNASFT